MDTLPWASIPSLPSRTATRTAHLTIIFPHLNELQATLLYLCFLIPFTTAFYSPLFPFPWNSLLLHPVLSQHTFYAAILVHNYNSSLSGISTQPCAFFSRAIIWLSGQPPAGNLWHTWHDKRFPTLPFAAAFSCSFFVSSVLNPQITRLPQ